jgi:hypothetical protein
MARVRCAAALLAALVFCGAAGARATGTAPTGLHGFVLRADEPVAHTFSRTPSFGWNPVRGARSYEFELSTSSRFTPNGTVWSADGLKTPAVAVPISLPWITGQPYSLYAHVRAVTNRGAGPWSASFGFNMRWTAVPTPLGPSYPGLLRWTRVPGASGYSVWLVDARKRFSTHVNMADEREYYTFHQDPSWSGVVHWRVRAERLLYGETANGIPTVSYGPWSPVYTSYNPPVSGGPLTPSMTRTDVVSDASHTRDHEVMPAFLFSGNAALNGTPYELYRVVVATDEDCLNVVFRGAIVGSPAYVPRETGPLALPQDLTGLDLARSSYLDFGTEPDSKTADGDTVRSNEMSGGPAQPAKIDLWDSDSVGGRYYWSVVPVGVFREAAHQTTLTADALAGDTTITVASTTGIGAGNTLVVGSPGGETVTVLSIAGNVITLTAPLQGNHAEGELVTRPGDGISYEEADLTQEACAAGHVLSFGKASEPAVTGQSAPFASGLSPDGKLVAAASWKPKFYGAPLVAWQPSLSTDKYQVEWSHTKYPWRVAGTQETYSTSLSLPLKPGTWFYRVRGLDSLMVGSRPELSWSNPVRLLVTKPRFRVVH